MSMSIKQNIDFIWKKISYIALKSGYNPSNITIVCISKNRSAEEVYQVLDAGISNIGESRVQEAQNKYLAIHQYAEKKNIALSFHMVGRLQTNKVNKSLEMFDLIQSVDSLRLAQKINEISKQKNKKADILIEVKTSKEEAKFGVSVDKTISLLGEISNLGYIQVRGLMTMAPLSKDKEEPRPYFRTLRKLRDKINEIDEPLFKQKIKMDYLSMGMSGDFEAAVEEGANMLRIGTAIFEGEL